MTAVASPPSVQSGPRLGWYASGNGGQGALTSSMNADEVSRMFMPRKNIQRSNSSSSVASSSSTSTVSASPHHGNAGQNANSESGTWSSKKRPSRSLWPSSKAEPVAGVTNARSQVVSAPSSGPTASSAMSAIHQPSPVVPSQHMLQSPQQNGIRPGAGPSNDPPAILTLVPINGTFERKQINVPYFPEVLRVGRQTNAKTVPTPVNGYFDSKVLSRQHAEIWADRSGKIWIRDVKSSNGTFVNGQRLSPENRDSEPHELREHDTLELGIDIVSEDQKSIVHHKVSAKVEHAGIYGASPNILDLNFGDIDPTSGGGLLPSPLSQPLSHLRGRPSSSMSNRSTQSAASNQMNALHQQRQMNYWVSPITIEQVVKKLSSEMRQAKQQSQDLRQTDEFLTSLIAQENSEKEKNKPSPIESNGGRQMNGKPKMPRIDPISRFSDPPAPPPQQPLPEKPDAPPLKRSDTEKSKSGNSPVSRESSQILSLIEALSSAKKELDTQGARVKELENMLRQERSARESAEERARKLEQQSGKDEQKSEIDAAFEPPPEQEKTATKEPAHEKASDTDGMDRPSDVVDSHDANGAASSTDSSTKELQERLETMIVEMEEMKKQVEQFKKRAEQAEEEKLEARKSLAEMIETLRRERAEADQTAEDKPKDGELPSGQTRKPSTTSSKEDTKPSEMLDSVMQSRHPVTPSQVKEIENAATAFATQRHRHRLLEQSTPYASMFGVVLLGVGIMAYLNGWQRVDK
ncbi:hypothetical protein VTN00DRAFT_1688 [Thermoascus crustaceus]|uniref:uncharacterized protein n=1 Tax=Thermoascus crustaceus TaxID=5088 RepID=UPI00374388D5